MDEQQRAKKQRAKAKEPVSKPPHRHEPEVPKVTKVPDSWEDAAWDEEDPSDTLKNMKVRAAAHATDLRLLLTRLSRLQNIDISLDTATKVIGFQNMRSCAYVHLVRVILEPHEQYEMTEAYDGRKIILKDETIQSGVDKPWKVIKSCHQFSEPMECDQECIEILLFKQTGVIRILWEGGCPRSTMNVHGYLFTKDWEGPMGLGDGDIIEVRLQPTVRDIK